MASYEKKDVQNIMEIYKSAGTPGDPHKLLARLEGSWATKAKDWMVPGGPAESVGTCEQRMILGDRFLRQEFTGDMKGIPFTGINFLGYNNHTKKYESVWMESMSTGIYYSHGTASADGKAITLTCNYDDPVKGNCSLRCVYRFKDDNTFDYEMFITPQGGKEEKFAEMTVTRTSAALKKAA